MQALFALAPIILILVLMIGMRWSAAAAGVAGLAATLAIALGPFEYGTTMLPELGPAPAVAGVFAEALFIAATILWIVFPALCIYELQLRSGAFDLLREAVGRLSGDRRILALLIAWFFALFLEGAAGFGTPIALAAPILVGLGFAPVPALTLVLIGHAAGVSFGAIGTPVLPQMAATGFTALQLSSATGLLHGALGWILLVFVVVLAGNTTSGDRRAKPWLWAGGAAVLFLLPFMAFAFLVGPELPTIGGALVGSAVFVALLRRWGPKRVDADTPPGAARLVQAALPYLALLTLILSTRLLPPLQDALRDIELSWVLPGGFAGSVQPLYHPGTMLVLGFVAGGLMQKIGPVELVDAAWRAARRLPKVIVALGAMLALSRLMVHAGMIGVLAEAAANLFGGAWPWFAPLVGVLGTFVTGSATASNVLLTDFQSATAERLGLPGLWLAGAQNFGAAVGNIVCPHNVVAGAATVGLIGREGEILRRTALACAAYALAGGALVALLV
ncbi:MAG TPA: L-lactate permease [Alphaproteobacteria bacterium]|nr:L-lactate permease [Alphaproteobacteria bacterium]